MELPTYSRGIVGRFCFSQQTVCKSGKIVMVTVEQYKEGFKAIASTDEGKLSHAGVKATARKAVNAIAKLI